MQSIIIPSPLRKFTRNQSVIQLKGDTVQKLIRNLLLKYPGLKPQLYAENNKLHKFLELYVDNQKIQQKDFDQQAVKENSTIAIVPIIAGG